jgi:molybdenum cofactor synthesis domain-containing protein
MKPTGSVNIEVISTGDELLYGRIPDTNSQWIAQRVAEMGAKLRRITTIGDEPETILCTLLEALKRDSHFIIFTGGLGPSEDDLTVDSIGKALNQKTIIDPEGAGKIRQVYEKRGLTAEASYKRGERMARVLEKSESMQNQFGFAVGMKVEVAAKTICTLPGVPEEMKGMFNAHIAPMIKSHATSVLLAKTYNISMIWKDFFPLFREMQRDYPEMYIKNASTPPVEGENRNNVHTIKVYFVLEALTQEEAVKKMEAFLNDYRQRIQAVGGGRIELLPREE